MRYLLFHHWRSLPGEVFSTFANKRVGEIRSLRGYSYRWNGGGWASSPTGDYTLSLRKLSRAQCDFYFVNNGTGDIVVSQRVRDAFINSGLTGFNLIECDVENIMLGETLYELRAIANRYLDAESPTITSKEHCLGECGFRFLSQPDDPDFASIKSLPAFTVISERMLNFIREERFKFVSIQFASSFLFRGTSFGTEWAARIALNCHMRGMSFEDAVALSARHAAALSGETAAIHKQAQARLKSMPCTIPTEFFDCPISEPL